MKKILTIMVAVSLSFSAFATAGVSAASFLKNPSDAMSIGLGDIGTSMIENGNAIFWNIGSAALLEKTSISVNGVLWGAELSEGTTGSLANNFSIGAGIPLGSFSIGVGAIINSYGEIARVSDVNGALTEDGTFSSSDTAIFAGAGYKLNSQVGVGANIKVLALSIDDATATAFALDIGVKYADLVPGLDAGLTLKNIGSKVTYDSAGSSLPMQFALGVNYMILNPEAKSFGLNAGVELGYDLTDSVGKASIGVEGVIAKIIALRAGYRLPIGGESAYSYSIGAGVKLAFGANKMSIDYALLPTSSIGSKNCFSLNIAF